MEEGGDTLTCPSAALLKNILNYNRITLPPRWSCLQMVGPRECYRYLTLSKAPGIDVSSRQVVVFQMQDLGDWNALFPESLEAGWVLAQFWCYRAVSTTQLQRCFGFMGM